MLIGIPSLLGPELLATLRAMGHGDEIAIVDGNYPAQEQAQPAGARRRSRRDRRCSMPSCSVLPVDDFVPEALFRAIGQRRPRRCSIRSITR